MSEEKKILIVSYYWPPAGGPGVQRWLKFVKYLTQFGWKPTVFIPENPSYPIVDATLEKDVSPDLEVIKTQIWEPYQIAELFGKSNKKFKAGQFDVAENQSWKSKLSIWVRGNFFIPDARVFWVKPSVKKLEKLFTEKHFEVLVTTGPPHSLHLIGLQLKKKFPELKWVADFRDPWTEISYHKHLKLTKNSDLKHRKLEEEVFKNADITLATSYSDAENFRRKGANAFCVTNGYDGEIKPHQNSTDKFTLSYIGVLEQLRNPDLLWEVLNDIVNENESFKQNFRLKFAGRVDDKILAQINNSELKNHVENLGYLSHQEANEAMQSSDLLLITNFPNTESKGIIPGKIFEYFASGNQILSFGPEQSDVERILGETQAGMHFSYQDKIQVKRYILEEFESWKSKSRSEHNPELERFSRKHLTGELVKILDQLIKK